MIDWHACLKTTQPVTLQGTLLRLVESQEQVATNQLVSSLKRQTVLEEMLEAAKPPRRKDSQALHYLLATPFRYPPLKHGSRFGRRNEPSLFYGSLETRTVLAEAAYYRFAFWFGMKQAPPGKLDTQHTLFEAAYRTAHGLQLQAVPFSAYRAELAHLANYSESQALGSAMREMKVHAFEFVSARDIAGGINVALFTPEAFANPQPLAQEPWLCELTGSHVRFRAAYGDELHDFPLAQFLVDEKFPQPA